MSSAVGRIGDVSSLPHSYVDATAALPRAHFLLLLSLTMPITVAATSEPSEPATVTPFALGLMPCCSRRVVARCVRVYVLSSPGVCCSLLLRPAVQVWGRRTASPTHARRRDDRRPEADKVEAECRGIEGRGAERVEGEPVAQRGTPPATPRDANKRPRRSKQSALARLGRP